MFNIGGGEFLVIALIALIVLGPTRLPDAARQVGKAMGELRKLSNGFQSELKSAFDDADGAKPGPRRDVLGAAPSAFTTGTSVTAEAAATADPPRPQPKRREPLRADGERPTSSRSAKSPAATAERSARSRRTASPTGGAGKATKPAATSKARKKSS